MKYAIFDLDMTLVDTSIAEEARKRRAWGEVYAMIPRFRLYDGVDRVIEHIRGNGIHICIVSSSPHAYVQKVVDYFHLPVEHIVGYHDADATKPSPAPMNEAVKLLGCRLEEVISFGDRAIDIISSNRAGIRSVACKWGSGELGLLSSSGYSNIISSPDEMILFL